WSNLSSKVRVELSTEWIIGIDVTERNQFEKSLNREKALLNSIINSIPHPIFYKDFECRYLGANPRFYEHTGLNEETLIGKKDEDIFPKGKVSVYKNSDKVIIATKKAKRDVMWDSSYSGKDVLLDTIKVPFFDNENNIIGITGISLDITAQHLTENELIKQKEKAEEADRLKSAFLANMSHEIRSPMNAIIGFSQLIFDSFKLEDELKEYINYISQSGNNLLHLIDDIIDIAKIEAGQIKIRKEPFDLNEMLKNLYVSFQTIINKSQNTKVSIHLKIPDNNKKVFINSDEFRIKQVLSNFISNSLKFTDNGYIEFGYEILPDSKILFYTKDTGIGIPESEQKKIFERFGQVEDTYTRNYKGTGLGLAISSSIINLLGGELWLDSLPGKGSTFYIKLSVEFNESTDVENSIPLEIEINSDWHDKLILIAEDDEMNYKLLKHALEKTLVQTIRAKTGEEAIDIFKNNKRIDLILMDIQMPKLNGFEATKIIKNIDKNIPVIALTAYAMHSEKEKCEEIGFDEFISKPFNINQLLNSISEFLK
ncbi:MAG: response regulator, partial [Bacteroidales bacterium]|nr:response regulator [Bacteroidales bacterium]MBN2758767.1 response regulator [Bacteroidales bacterium]